MMIWTKTEDLNNTELNVLPIYDDRYQNSNQNRTYDDKVCTIFRDLSAPKERVECKSHTAISIDSLLNYDNNYYLQLYLRKSAYKIICNQMEDYLNDNPIETGDN